MTEMSQETRAVFTKLHEYLRERQRAWAKRGRPEVAEALDEVVIGIQTSLGAASNAKIRDDERRADAEGRSWRIE